MLRRSHKKSKNGCAECKRRHVKCDEARPQCRLCVNSDRPCTYTTSPPSSQPSPAPDEPASSSSSISDLPVPSSNNTHIPTGDTIPSIVNLDHMELLLHITTTRTLFSLAVGHSAFPQKITLGIQIALKNPYYLHQLLAYSARHLAFLHPEQSSKYHNLAVTLQTRAVSLYNATEKEITQENCVPVILFAATLGHHVLADTLAERGRPGGLKAFTERFARGLDIQRGVATIFLEVKPFLMGSILGDVMAISMDLTGRERVGKECDGAREIVMQSRRLDEEEKEACVQALHFIQVGFDVLDAYEPGSDGFQHQHEMCFTWTIMLKPKFAVLLAAQHPDALGILGYYAVLLHLGKDHWQIQDAGAYILDLLIDHMGTTESQWLDYPRQRIPTSIV